MTSTASADLSGPENSDRDASTTGGGDAPLLRPRGRRRAQAAVRAHVDDYNSRIVEARRQLTGGPPVVTPTRDVDDELRRWRERREERRAARAAAVEPAPPTWRERRALRRELRRRRREG